MNISSRRVVTLATLTGGGIVLVATGVFDLSSKNQLLKASFKLFDSSTVKWGAIFTAIFGVVYLLVSKNALKRKVVEYGEIGYVVHNGSPMRHRFGKRKRQLVVRRAGQAKNVIPKLYDMVVVSWLHDILEVKNLEFMYGDRRVGYDLAIEYSMAEPMTEEDVEALAAMAFSFRDRNRYNEEAGAFERFIENRSIAAVPLLVSQLPAGNDGLPLCPAGGVDALGTVSLARRLESNDDITTTIKLATLRLTPINMRFTDQIVVRNV